MRPKTMRTPGIDLCGLIAALFLSLMPLTAAAATCRTDRFEGIAYTACTTTIGKDDLRIWLNGTDGQPFGSFGRIEASLAPDHLRLGFAMNAGMYRPNRAPVGMLIIDGKPLSRLITRGGGGNFGLLPNGIFCMLPDRYAVIETKTYAAAPPPCRYATQSGPMLVIGGALHPRFLKDATSTNIRNGVGVSADGRTATFVISDVPVTFYDFARLFRDGLHLPDALYLDGSISRLDAPELGRADIGLPLGPILGTVVPLDGAVDAPAPGQ